jgi:hypothetical protein
MSKLDKFLSACEKIEWYMKDAIDATYNANVEEWLLEQGYEIDDDEKAFMEVARFIVENSNKGLW